MAEQKIELRKIRDFSENISDTLVFIKQNFKPLVLSFLAISGIFLLASSVFSGMYQSQFGGLFKQIFSRGIIPAGGRMPSEFSPFQMINQNYFLYVLFTWMSISAMHVSIVSYMKLYQINHKQAPGIQEVWDMFKKYYLRVLFYSVPVFILIVGGCVFCIAPGIYLAVVFTIFPVVVMVEDKSFAEAFSRCFELIKQNFWPSLVIYFVVYLIYSFSASIIGFMMAAITGVISYFSTKDVTATIGIVTSVLTAVTFVFYIVFYVSVALQYFTLAEKRDGTGMLDRLDKLGEGGRDFNNIQEQY